MVQENRVLAITISQDLKSEIGSYLNSRKLSGRNITLREYIAGLIKADMISNNTNLILKYYLSSICTI